MNKRFSILAASLAIFAVSACAQEQACTVNQTAIGATLLYSASGSEADPRHIYKIWRNGDDLLHEDDSTNMAEQWHRIDDDKVKIDRYFDTYKRTIEYQPAELVKTRTTQDWATKYWLITPDMLKSAKKVSSAGQACDRVDTYSFTNDDVDVKLEWLPALSLIRSQTVKTKEQTFTWTLQSWTDDATEIEAAFAARDGYQSTDYADIGDNESDPFLAKMINLGFVDHGASGFYDSHGNPSDVGHKH